MAKIGALFLYPSIKKIGTRVDYQRYGGAVLLGVNGAVIKAHGRSKSPAIANAIGAAYTFAARNALDRIRGDVATELEKSGSAANHGKNA